MKVTALIPDDLIERVRTVSGGKNITDSLIIALNEYLTQKEIKNLYKSIDEEPLTFKEDFTAYKVRKLNRDR
ncbi:DUF2191 domain-containing protein [Bacteroidota bacterium]